MELRRRQRGGGNFWRSLRRRGKRYNKRAGKNAGRGLISASWSWAGICCARAAAGRHCSSCNIDYGRNFTRNVELTFHPEPWLRPLPEGELCLLGQGTTLHVKFQAEVAAHTRKSFAMALRPGPYRFRTVEVGGGADTDIAADGMIPEVTASSRDFVLVPPGHKDEIVVTNDTDRPLFFVVEEGNHQMVLPCSGHVTLADLLVAVRLTFQAGRMQ